MKKNLEDLFTVIEAAAYIGIARTTIYRLINEGRIKPLTIGHLSVFTREALDKLKSEYFAAGLGHVEIAAMYGQGRTTVIYQFKRLGVKPKGFDNRRRGAAIYDVGTVKDAAEVLGWELVQQNQTDGSLDPSPVEREAV